MNGVGYIPIMIGTLAIAKVYKNIEKLSREGEEFAVTARKVSLEITRLRELIRMRVRLVKPSLIGIIIGIVPASGGAIASLVSYGEAVRSSKTPGQFGGIAENALRQQLIISDGNWLSFFTRPLSLLILIFAVVALLSPYFRKDRKAKSKSDP